MISSQVSRWSPPPKKNLIPALRHPPVLSLLVTSGHFFSFSTVSPFLHCCYYPHTARERQCLLNAIFWYYFLSGHCSKMMFGERKERKTFLSFRTRFLFLWSFLGLCWIIFRNKKSIFIICISINPFWLPSFFMLLEILVSICLELLYVR